MPALARRAFVSRRRPAIALRNPSGFRNLMRSNIAPGVARPGEGLLAQGFGVATLGSTDTVLQMTANPQKPIKLERLIIETTDVGAPAAGILTLEVLGVGVESQLVGTGGIPVTTFAAKSVGVRLNGDVAVPGVDINMGLNRTAAPGGTASVVVAAAVLGRSVV